jgi:hypothetical protein
VLARTGDSARTQPGVPRGLRRTGEMRTRAMPVFDRFTPTLVRALPEFYVVPVADTALIAALARHGISTESATLPQLGGEEFVVDSLVRNARPFQGHNEVRLVGHWRNVPAFAFAHRLVSTRRPWGVLAAYLLDPESDDGFATWNAFDAVLSQGSVFPVRRTRNAP